MPSNLDSYLQENPPGPQLPPPRPFRGGNAVHTREGLTDKFIPPFSQQMLQALGMQGPASTMAAIPEDIRSLLTDVEPAVQKLGEGYDYKRLGEIATAGKDRLPPDVYTKMVATSALGYSRQFNRKSGAIAEFGLQGSYEAARQVVPALPEMAEPKFLSPQGEAIAKSLGALAGVGVAGTMVIGALNRVTKLPAIASVFLKLPERVREITLGVGAGAILDAARPDGLPDEPMAIDVAARLAHPLAKAMGDSETAQRAALAITGGLTGGAIGEVIGPVFRAIDLGRETYLASKLSPEMIGAMREHLAAAGIPIGQVTSNRSVVKQFLGNMDKLSLSERMASVAAADEERTSYILNMLYNDPNFGGPPTLPRTVVVDPAKGPGQPMQVYHGTRTQFEGALQTEQPSPHTQVRGGKPPFRGLFFTVNPEEAGLFAKIRSPINYDSFTDAQGQSYDRLMNSIDTDTRGMALADQFRKLGHDDAMKLLEMPHQEAKDLLELPIEDIRTTLGTQGGERIFPAYLDIRNPYRPQSGNEQEIRELATFLQNKGDLHQDQITSIFNDAKKGKWNLHPGDFYQYEDEIADFAKSKGYDGIYLPDVGIDPTIKKGGNTGWFIAFDQSQVYYAGASDDVKYLGALFRTNPGGLSIAKGVRDIRAADIVANRLGINVVSLKVGNDYLIMRPQVRFPEGPAVGAKLANQVADFSDYVLGSSKGKNSTMLSILPDGSATRGNYEPADIVARYKIKPPIVKGEARPDIAVREHFGVVGVSVGEGGKITVDLPSQINNRQAAFLTKMADRGPEEMVINGVGNKSKTLTKPVGAQVEDALAELVPGTEKPKVTAEMTKKAQQYQREGVFEGQAAVLPDGYPVKILRRTKAKKGYNIQYEDPLTNFKHTVSEDNISLLSTSLEGELAPTNLFASSMEEKERVLLGTLRKGINEGLTKPITNFRQLESFASSRGKLVSQMGRGKFKVFDPNTGEALFYDSFKSSLRGVRESIPPLPDVTPPEIEQMFGFKPNIGQIGNGGPPHRFGEGIPLTDDDFDKAALTKTLGMLPPGAIQQAITPTRGLMLDLEKRYNLPFGRVFLNLQESTVRRQNYVAAWIYGDGPGLHEGVRPLHEIYQMAGGKGANQRLITQWLESETDDTIRKTLERDMTPQEIAGAKELRKWYGVASDKGLFRSLGVEEQYLYDYAPHIRANAEVYGNDITELWRKSKGTPLPRSVDFFADYARDGTLALYEDRAFVAASQYVNAGARTRFMNTAMSDAKKLLRAVPDNAVKGPLVNYIEALRGSEFAPQRAALDASFARFMGTLGASDTVAKDVGERLSLALLGLSYSATMGFRPGLALRNAAQILQTTWPLLGKLDDNFALAIGRALTTQGRNEAIAAGAIAMRQSAVFAGEDVAQAMPPLVKGLTEYGLKLYDGADTFARAVSFHVAKGRSDRAIESFAKALVDGGDPVVAQRALIKNSGAMALDKPIVDEYLRRVANSPQEASNFVGKQLTDVTQYLYGRGNQPRWMRSVPGRFFGQFGTWPLWYIDFVKRSVTNLWQNGYKTEAIAFVGKMALVDAAIYEAGDAIGLDFRKWMAGNALFYTGGPAIQLMEGTINLMRGGSEQFLGSSETPGTKQRIADGINTLEKTGLAFIPNSYAVRDIGRLLSAAQNKNPTEFVAAMLAVRPSNEFTVQQRMDMLFAPGRMSTDIDLESGDPTTQTAVELMVKGLEVAAGRERIQVPQAPGGPLPTRPQGAARGAGAPPKGSSGPQSRLPGRPPMEPTALPPELRRGESKPVQY